MRSSIKRTVRRTGFLQFFRIKLSQMLPSLTRPQWPELRDPTQLCMQTPGDPLERRSEERTKRNALAFMRGGLFFNAGNGRCESCKGLGYKQVEMQFLSDIQIPCEQCEGKRFKDELLQVKLDGLSVHDILNLYHRRIIAPIFPASQTFRKLSMLCKVGLGYLNLGQPLNTLSGGNHRGSN